MTKGGDPLPPEDVDVVGGRGVAAIGLPGRAALELGAGPPSGGATAYDHVLAESATDDLQVRGASVRGLLHRHRRQPRQDDFSVVHDPVTDVTVVVVCDGVGSLARSGEAADFVARTLPGVYLREGKWETAVAVVNEALTRLAAQPPPPLPGDPERTHPDHGGPSAPHPGFPAEDRADRPDETEEPDMATTMVGVAVHRSPSGRHVRIAWTDDSTVWHLSPQGEWTALTPSDLTRNAVLHTGSVRALPAHPSVVHVREVPFTDGALFVMTDGVGLPLASASDVRSRLAEWWATPPDVFTFGRQVGFARKTHNDDRTVVGLWSEHDAASGDLTQVAPDRRTDEVPAAPASDAPSSD